MTSICFTINLNTTVRVTLTDHGLHVMRTHFCKLGLSELFPPHCMRRPGCDRIWEGPLWDLMKMIGSGMSMGAPQVIARNRVDILEPSAVGSLIEQERRDGS